MTKKLVVVILALVFGVGMVMLAFMEYSPSGRPGKSAAVQSAGGQPKANDEFVVDESSLPPVIVSVNGVEIGKDVFIKIIHGLKRQLAMRGQKLTEETYKNAKGEILKNIIHAELLLQEAKAMNYTASDEEVNARLDKMKSQYESEEKFLEDLSRQGFTLEMLKKQMNKGLAINAMLDAEIYVKVSVSEEKAKEYYEKNREKFDQPETVKARHILLRLAPDADDATVKKVRAKMDEIVGKLESGEDFAELAKKYSEGPSSLKGGDLGFFGRGAMIKEFEDVAFSLKPGDKPQVVRTRFGFHLIETLEKREAGVSTYQDVKGKIFDQLAYGEKTKLLNEYIAALKKKAEIKVFI
jgi:peptidyl-prolyl cis-trans isomerase C